MLSAKDGNPLAKKTPWLAIPTWWSLEDVSTVCSGITQKIMRKSYQRSWFWTLLTQVRLRYRKAWKHETSYKHSIILKHSFIQRNLNIIAFKISTDSWEPLKFQEKQLFLTKTAKILARKKMARVVFAKVYSPEPEIWIYKVKHTKAHILNVDTGEISMTDAPKTKGFILT